MPGVAVLSKPFQRGLTTYPTAMLHGASFIDSIVRVLLRRRVGLLLWSRRLPEPDDCLLRTPAEDHGRHAMTVDLIGCYIGEFCGGQVDRLRRLADLDLSDLDAEFDPRVTARRTQERRFARVAERLCHAACEWALARNAKDALCWSALVQARIELANANQIRSEANEGNKNSPFVSFVTFCSDHLESGQKFARACGDFAMEMQKAATGTHKTIPVLFAKCKPSGLLVSRIHIHLVGLSKDAAKKQFHGIAAAAAAHRHSVAETQSVRTAIVLEYSTNALHDHR